MKPLQQPRPAIAKYRRPIPQADGDMTPPPTASRIGAQEPDDDGHFPSFCGKCNDIVPVKTIDGTVARSGAILLNVMCTRCGLTFWEDDSNA